MPNAHNSILPNLSQQGYFGGGGKTYHSHHSLDLLLLYTCSSNSGLHFPCITLALPATVMSS